MKYLPDAKKRPVPLVTTVLEAYRPSSGFLCTKRDYVAQYARIEDEAPKRMHPT